MVGADQLPTVTVADIPPNHSSDLGAADPRGTSAGLFLLDVREPEEWTAGHIDGAVHIPMGELTGRLDEVPRSARVVAVCRSGHRSGRVTAFLVDGGWDAYNLEGGMMAWASAARPMTADTSVPPFVL